MDKIQSLASAGAGPRLMLVEEDGTVMMLDFALLLAIYRFLQPILKLLGIDLPDLPFATAMALLGTLETA